MSWPLVVLAWLATLVQAGQSPTSFLSGDSYDSFAAAMTGPGCGCKGWFYRTWDCTQETGKQPTCHETTIYSWTCRVHPYRIDKDWDLDGDLDVDLADFAAFQNVLSKG